MTDRPNKKILKSESDQPNENHESDIDSAIFQLEMVHIDLDKLNDKENEEILTIEQKYKKLRQQYFIKRSEIIENIPDFWFNVFTSHPDICHILYEDEEDCLHYLKKVEIESADNIKSGYVIKLYFSENPYFKNDVLTKEFFYKQGNLSSTSTKMEWKKPHPAFSLKDSCPKPHRKRSHQFQEQTFFGWFNNNEDPTNDVIAEIIKDDIWPNSLQYYLVPDPDMEGQDGKEDDSSDSSDMEESFEISTEKCRNFRSSEPGTSK